MTQETAQSILFKNCFIAGDGKPLFKNIPALAAKICEESGVENSLSSLTSFIRQVLNKSRSMSEMLEKAILFAVTSRVMGDERKAVEIMSKVQSLLLNKPEESHFSSSLVINELTCSVNNIEFLALFLTKLLGNNKLIVVEKLKIV